MAAAVGSRAFPEMLCFFRGNRTYFVITELSGILGHCTAGRWSRSCAGHGCGGKLGFQTDHSTRSLRAQSPISPLGFGWQGLENLGIAPASR